MSASAMLQFPSLLAGVKTTPQPQPWKQATLASALKAHSSTVPHAHGHHTYKKHHAHFPSRKVHPKLYSKSGVRVHYEQPPAVKVIKDAETFHA